MSGSEAVALRARAPSVGRALAKLSPAFLLLFAPAAAAAALDRAFWPALALAGPSALASLVWALTRNAPAPDDLRGVEALIVVALTFLLGTVGAAPAFWTLGMTPVDALFEATSAMTTTGLTMAPGAGDWPLSAHFLRAWLQWCAGLAFLASALALLVGPGAVARRLGVAGLGPEEDLMSSTRARARSFLRLYTALTLLAAAAAAALADPWIEGVLLSLAAVSTAGFSPAADSLAGQGRALQAVVMAACFIGALSFPLLLSLRRKGARRLMLDPALRLMLYLLCGGFAAIALIEGAGADDIPAAMADAAVQATSALTTAGFSSEAVGAMAPASLLVLILLMTVGGDVGSTAGGLKATRVVAALAAFRLTLARTQAPPGAVTPLRALAERYRAEDVAGLAALATIYAATAAALWFAFLLGGAPALPALFDVVSALSTVGLSAGVVGPELPSALKLALIAGMLLGRLEFFALLALLRPATWI